MPMNDVDPAMVAQSAFLDEAQILQSLIAQCATGGASAKVELGAELSNANQLRTIYAQEIPGLDTAIIDNALAQANATLAGQLAPVVVTASASPAQPAAAAPAGAAPSGLKLGNVVIPWSGVLVGVGLLGFALYVSTRKKR